MFFFVCLFLGVYGFSVHVGAGTFLPVRTGGADFYDPKNSKNLWVFGGSPMVSVFFGGFVFFLSCFR